MATPRLQHQFIRLWQHCQGNGCDTTLAGLAAALNCSRRHVRTLLNAMQQQGWLSWKAASGRGKRSRLAFLCNALEVQQRRAEELMEQDHFEQLVQLVGDRDSARQMLLAQLGRSFRQGAISCEPSITARCSGYSPPRRYAARRPIWPDRSSAASPA